MKKSSETKEPRPFYRKARSAWFVQLRDGRQVNLGPDKDEAFRKYHLLMAQPPPAKARKSLCLVADLAEDFLASKQTLRKNTVKLVTHIITPFAEKFGTRRASDITSEEVVSWIGERGTWNESTKWTVFHRVVEFFNWCVLQKVIVRSPFQGVKCRWRCKNRTRVFTETEFAKLLEHAGPQFRIFLRWQHALGCRPGELCSVRASHLDPTHPILVLQTGEHKTGEKTGKPRRIVIPQELIEEVREAARQHPTGAMLRNTRGTAWNVNTVDYQMRQVRGKAGFGKDVVLYTNRHTFATNLMTSGVPDRATADLMGHVGTRMLDKYIHAQLPDLIEALNKRKKD